MGLFDVRDHYRIDLHVVDLLECQSCHYPGAMHIVGNSPAANIDSQQVVILFWTRIFVFNDMTFLRYHQLIIKQCSRP